MTLQEVCRRVLAAGTQQERLIEALLTLAHGERGLDRRAPLDVRAITGRVVEGRTAEAADRDVRLTADLDPVSALGDRDLIERLVDNLVDNAIRHNVPDGTVTVTTGGTRLAVSNTGPVVPPGELDRLFQPFQRLRRERTTGGAGHGLGLAIVAAIAAAHGARLDARALPTGGLCVEVDFVGTEPGERAAARGRRTGTRAVTAAQPGAA